MLTIHRLAFLNIQTGTGNVLTKLYKYRVINLLAQGIFIFFVGLFSTGFTA